MKNLWTLLKRCVSPERLAARRKLVVLAVKLTFDGRSYGPFYCQWRAFGANHKRLDGLTRLLVEELTDEHPYAFGAGDIEHILKTLLAFNRQVNVDSDEWQSCPIKLTDYRYEAFHGRYEVLISDTTSVLFRHYFGYED